MLRFDPIASHGPQHLPDLRHSQLLLGALALLVALLALAAEGGFSALERAVSPRTRSRGPRARQEVVARPLAPDIGPAA